MAGVILMGQPLYVTWSFSYIALFFNFYFSVQLVFILYLLDVFYASGTLISIYFLFGRNCFQTNHIKIVIAVFNSYADYSSLNVRWKNPATVDSNR